MMKNLIMMLEITMPLEAPTLMTLAFKVVFTHSSQIGKV